MILTEKYISGIILVIWRHPQGQKLNFKGKYDFIIYAGHILQSKSNEKEVVNLFLVPAFAESIFC